MPFRLIIHPPQGPVRHVALETGRDYVLGRQTGCDIQLADTRLSRRHARLRCEDDGYLLTDLSSKNGLMVDGRPVREGWLHDGSWVSFGGLLARLENISERQLAAEAAYRQSRRDTSRRLTASLDPALGSTALLRRVLDSVLHLCSMQRGFILLIRDRSRLDVACAHGLAEADPAEFEGSVSAVGLALRSGEVVVISDTGKYPPLAGKPSIVSGGIRAIACVPLRIGQALQGAIYTDSLRAGMVFTDLDVEILQNLGEQAALALGATNLRDELINLRNALRQEVPGLTKALPTLRRALQTEPATAFRSEKDWVPESVRKVPAGPLPGVPGKNRVL